MRLACLALLALLVTTSSAEAQSWGRWHALGPFAHPQGASDMESPQPTPSVERALKTMLAGAEGPDLAAPLKTKEGTLRWVECTRGDAGGRALDVGVLDLNELLKPAGAPDSWNVKMAGYLYRRVECESALDLPVMCGSDDGLRLWLDGELLIDRGSPRSLVVEDHQLTLHLKAGVNHLLVKVVNETGPWSFQLARWKRIEQAAIDRAIDRGVQCLIDAQLLDGSWGDHEEFGAGHAAFTTYTLLECGVAPGDAAVQMALTAIDARAVEHTYAAACLVLALEATHDERMRARIEAAVRQLEAWQNGQDLYTYPQLPGYPGTLPPDLSNTLYAALAFRAAERMGIAVPDKVWADLAQGTLRCLTKEQLSGNATGKLATRSAGFTYRASTGEATGSMTTAGLSVLALAQEGTQGKLPAAIAQRAKNAVPLGLAWLDRNMQWFQNPGQNGHHYFWIYGLERAGTLLGLDILGGIDWYWAGAAYLIKKQRDNGSWSSGGAEADEPIDTLLALLFLKRATAPVTGEPLTGTHRGATASPSTRDTAPQVASWEAGGAQDALAIHARGESTTMLWVSGLREDLRAALSGPKGLELQSLEFLGRCSDDPEGAEQLLGQIGARNVQAADLPRLELAHVFERPGTWSVRARLRVLVQGTQPRTVETPVLALVVRSVFDRRRLEYARDAARNLLRGLEVKVEASSNPKAAHDAVDGRQVSAWSCDASDAAPWIRLTPERPLLASRLLLSHASCRLRDAQKPRVREVEVLINGDTRLRLAMDADVRLKSTLELPPKTPIRTLELRVLSLHGARLGESAVGFAEIELVK